MIREILFPKWEKPPELVWYSTHDITVHLRSVILWFWIVFPLFGLLLFQIRFSKEMTPWSFWTFLAVLGLVLSGIIWIQAWLRARGSWTLELHTPWVVDFDRDVLIKIIRKHLGPTSAISVRDDSLIIQLGAKSYSLYCGKPDDFFGEWYLHSVKGEKLRLDNPILEPLRKAVIEFLNRDIPLDDEDEAFESTYKGPIPDWFKEGFEVNYLETHMEKSGRTSETKVEYRVVRNRAGSLLIKHRMIDDACISQHVKTIDDYYQERDWWMFHMPLAELHNKKPPIGRNDSKSA